MAREVNRRAIRTLAFEAFPSLSESTTKPNLVKMIQAANRKVRFKLFETIVAYRNDLLLWENLSCEVLEARGAYRYRQSFPDYGIDCASADLATVAQAKWYEPRSNISFRSASTFFTYSTILQAPNKLLVTSEDVKPSSGVQLIPGITHGNISDSEFADTILECCRDETMPAAPALTDAEFDELFVEETPITASAIEELEVYAANAHIDESGHLSELPAAIAEPPATIAEKISLRSYQTDAVELLSESLRGNAKIVKLIMACGAGKTVVGVELLKKCRDTGKIWAWMVPSIHLLEQARRVLARWAPDLTVALVGGGHSLDKSQEQPSCIICVYNSVRHIADLEFGVVIVDEGHHVVEQLQAEDVTGYLGAITKLKCAKHLLMSATMAEDDEEPADYTYDLEAAIKDGNLCDYEICIPVLTSGTNRQPALAALIVDNASVWNSVLAYCNSREEGKRFLSILQSLGVSAAYLDGETLLSERLSMISQFEASRIRVLVTVYVLGEGVDIPCADTCIFIEPRSSSINVIQCVGRVLRKHPSKALAHVILPAHNEERELARFLRILDTQDKRILRAIRSRSTGHVSLVTEEATESNEVAKVHYTSIFDRLGKSTVNGDWDYKYALLQAYVAEFGKLPAQKIEYKGVQLGTWVSNQRRAKKGKCGRMTEERVAILEAVDGWFWEKDLDAGWNQTYAMLQAYVAEFGKQPSGEMEYKGVQLGSWASDQRRAKRGKYGCRMTEERVAMLEAVDGWFWEKDLDAVWNQTYALLQAYVAEFGEQPSSKTEYKGVQLGGWVGTQRRVKKEKGSGHMTEERTAMLEAIDGWLWEKDLDAGWNQTYALLQAYVAEFGKQPSGKMEYKGVKLGLWASNQRAAKKGKVRSCMTDDRVQKLEATPGWFWEKDLDAGWNQTYALLQAYVAEFGKLPSARTEYKSVQLGSWISHQRGAKKGKGRGRMTEERAAMLEAIPGWVWEK